VVDAAAAAAIAGNRSLEYLNERQRGPSQVRAGFVFGVQRPSAMNG